MSKHAAPAPAALERPEPYLLTAAAVAGLLLGAAGVAVLVAAGVATALAALALAPAPGERQPRYRAYRQAYIPVAVYVGIVGSLVAALLRGGQEAAGWMVGADADEGGADADRSSVRGIG
jgi:hypothetical protein